MQILGLQPWISKVFLTVGQKNFGNKVPFLLPTRHHPSSWQTRITKTHNYQENVAIHRPINHLLLTPHGECEHSNFNLWLFSSLLFFSLFCLLNNITILTFLANLYIPIIFSNLNNNCSNVLDLRNLQKQVKKEFCFKNCADLSLIN